MPTFTTTSRVSAAGAARFGRHVAKVELLATVAEPGRPLGLLGGALAAVVAVNAVLLGVSWLMAVVAFVGVLFGWLALIWALTRFAVSRACARAAGHWRYVAESGALAVGLRGVDPRTGGWLLQSMAAHPRRAGAGSELMRLICAQADAAGAAIALVAVSGRAARWYTRFGFRRAGRVPPLGHWRMERSPGRRAETFCGSRTVL